MAQRNAALAAALGIEEAKRETEKRPVVEWEPVTIQYFGENLHFGKSVESQLEAFVKSDKPTLNLAAQPWARRRFTHEVAEAYGLASESIDEGAFLPI